MSANMILLKTQYLWLKHVYCILITHTLLLKVGGRYLWRGPAPYLNPKYVNLNLNLNRHFIMIFLQIELWFRTIFSCLLLPGDQPTTERGKGGDMEDFVWCLVGQWQPTTEERKGWLDGGQRGFWEQAAFIPSTTALRCVHFPEILPSDYVEIFKLGIRPKNYFWVAISFGIGIWRWFWNLVLGNVCVTLRIEYPKMALLVPMKDEVLAAASHVCGGKHCSMSNTFDRSGTFPLNKAS